MATLFITKGLPASGKSTTARQMVLESGGKMKRCNKDDLRDMINAREWSPATEPFIIEARNEIVKLSLNQGFDVVVDDTNLNPVHERQLRKLAAPDHDFVVMDSFLEVPLEECIARDKARRDKPGEIEVGEMVIRRMWKDWTKTWHNKNTDFIYPKIVPYEAPKGAKPVIIVDIDGTVAHNYGHRGWHDYHKVGNDTFDGTIIELLAMHALSFPEGIIMMSGRPESCREETELWLARAGIKYQHLFMRTTGDHRQDWIVKYELFDAHIRDNYDVRFVLDDRDQVVRMWRRLGLKCLQVADGNF